MPKVINAVNKFGRTTTKFFDSIVKFCRDCGTPKETGSQIWYACPKDGSWKSSFDRCENV